MKKEFPDLNKDGKVTKADILKGRGVKGFEHGGMAKAHGSMVSTKGNGKAIRTKKCKMM